MIYARIQTNRMKIKKVLEEFQANYVADELFLAARPLPKKVLEYYYGIARVVEGSHNYECIRSIKNFKLIGADDFEIERSAMNYFWASGIETSVPQLPKNYF